MKIVNHNKYLIHSPINNSNILLQNLEADLKGSVKEK